MSDLDPMADDLDRDEETVPDVFSDLMGDTGAGSCPWCGGERGAVVRPGEPEPGEACGHSDCQRFSELRTSLSRAEDRAEELEGQLARAEARARAWATLAGTYAGRLGVEPECMSEHACPVERREYREAWDRAKGEPSR